MTAPGGSVGTAYISFHARTDRLAPELEAALRDATDDADDFLDRAGTQWGDTLSDSTSKEIRKHGRDFADSMEHALTGQVVSLGGVRYKVDRRGFLHDFDTGQFAGKLVSDIVEALDSASQKGGPFSKVGEGIADAVGAGFNVSGRSPLIALLIPAILAIGEVIVAAIQAVNALIALIAALPALIGAVALQVGILAVAFDGVGGAVQKAFAAKNAQELNDAIKDLTPSAQEFVRSLLPLKDLFTQIKAITQEAFFKGFGNTVSLIIGELRGILTSGGIARLAQSLGEFFRGIGIFFASPVFVDFIRDVIPSTIRWLQDFGPHFISFLSSLVKMGDAALPFLERIGMAVGNALQTFSDWIQKQINSGKFQGWLDNMADTVDKLVELFFSATQFVASFLDAIDKAGGNEAIQELGDALLMLGAFLQTDAGREGLTALIDLTIFGLQALTGLLMLILTIAGSIRAFFVWLFETAIPGIGEFFGDIRDQFEEWGNDLWNWLLGIGQDIYQWFADLPENIGEAFMSLVNKLGDIATDAANALMDNLWTGIKNKIPSLGSAMSSVASTIASWLPGSPAEKGPLSGEGYSMIRGQNLVKDFAKGMNMEVPLVNNAAANVAGSTFNATLNFNGPPPTVSQAKAAGAAVSGELGRQLADSSIRLAMRMA